MLLLLAIAAAAAAVAATRFAADADVAAMLTLPLMPLYAI